MVINFAYASKNHFFNELCVSAKVITTQHQFTEIRPAYISAFLNAYKDYNPESLNVRNEEYFLGDSFSEDMQNLGKPGFYPIKVVNAQQKLVAYMSLDNIDELRLKDASRKDEFATLPSSSIYIRQFFVNLNFSRKGIGMHVLNDIIPKFTPCAHHYYLAVRRLNNPAIQLYKKCGFNQCAANLHNLSAEQYINLEKHF